MIKILLVVLTTGMSVSAWARENIKSIYLNNQGVEKLERSLKLYLEKSSEGQEDPNVDWVSAEPLILKALAEDPFNPILRINLGWTYERQRKFEKARKEYDAALRLPNLPSELKVIAHFNAGNAAVGDEDHADVDLALQHYQSALDAEPDDEMAKIVKTNIELLFQGGQGKGKGKKKGGKGGQGDQDQNQDQGDQGENPNQNPQNGDQQEKKQKPQFKSENLTKEDVRKILEELKSQENKIRGLEYGTKGKEAPAGKDW